MDSLSPNPILEFNPNQLIEVRKLFGYDDLNRLHQDIKILRDWIKKQEHFLIKEYDEVYLERQLICSKGSIERAKKRIDKLCTLRGLMPEYLQGFDIEHEFKNLLKVTNTCLLPKPTPDHYRIIFTDYFNPDVSIYNPSKMARYLLVMVEYLIKHDYSAGIEMICDFSKLTFAIVSTLNPMIVGNTLMLMTDAVGLRLKGMHCISGGSKFVDTFLAIAKAGVSKKIGSRLHGHDNFESLFKFISKDRLPVEVGGDLPNTLREITDNTLKEFSTPEFMKQIKFIEGARTDENKRLITKFNEDYSGMPGSFKVLSVD